MMVTFMESGMTFKMEKDNLFRIEKSQEVIRMQSFKPCECVVRSGKFLDLIEAKSSAPNPHSGDKTDFNTFYKEIEQKFIDSLLYTTGITAERRNDAACPVNVKGVQLSVIKYRFYLIIKNLEDRHLPD